MHYESYLWTLMVMMEFEWVILIEREIMTHSLAPSEISRIFKLEIHGRSRNRQTGPNFWRGYRDQRTADLVRISKGGWMDPWTAESVQIFQKDCRDPWTADLVRFLKGMQGPTDGRIRPIFSKVMQSSTDGRTGLNFEKGMQGSTDRYFGSNL